MGNRRLETKDNTNEGLKVTTINITGKVRETMEKMIEWGLIASKSEYMRKALNNQIRKDLKFIVKVEDVNKGILNDNMIRIPGQAKMYKIVRRLE